jgi:hypothetical protein
MILSFVVIFAVLWGFFYAPHFIMTCWRRGGNDRTAGRRFDVPKDLCPYIAFAAGPDFFCQFLSVFAPTSRIKLIVMLAS